MSIFQFSQFHQRCNILALCIPILFAACDESTPVSDEQLGNAVKAEPLKECPPPIIEAKSDLLKPEETIHQVPEKKMVTLQDVVDFLTEIRNELNEQNTAEPQDSRASRFTHCARLLSKVSMFQHSGRIQESSGWVACDPLTHLIYSVSSYSEQLLDCTKIFVEEGIVHPHDIFQNYETTPLAAAADKGFLPVVEYLVGLGVDVRKGGVIRRKNKDEEKKSPTPLARACAGGHYEVAVYLLERGAAAGGIDENPTLLHDACRGQSRQLVELLIQRGYDLNKISDEGDSPLGIACKNGDASIAQLLIERGASVNAISKERSPISWACATGNVELVKLLLSRGAKITADSNADSPLIKAVEAGHKEVVELLIQAGGNVNVRGDHEMSALIIAIAKGYTDIAAILEKNGAKASPQYLLKGNLHSYVYEKIKAASSRRSEENKPIAFEGIEQLIQRGWLKLDNNSASSILHVAIEYGDPRIVKLMINNGADVNSVSPSLDINCLHMAVMRHGFSYGSPEIIKMLLNHGARIDDMKALMRTAVSVNREYEKDSLELVKYFKEKGFDVNAVYEDGESSLALALRLSFFNHARYFMENGAVVQASSSGKNSALHQYAIGGTPESIDILDALLAKGLGVNDEGKDGLTPLQYSCLADNVEAAKQLISKGADPNMCSMSHPCPLIIAIDHENYEMAKLLIESGCELNQTDADGLSALMHSASKGNVQMVKLLLENNADAKLVSTFPPHSPRTDESALWSAVIADDYEITDLLSSVLKRGASPEVDAIIERAINVAIENKAYKAYIALGKYYDLPKERLEHKLNEKFILWTACREHNYDMVKAAIEQGYSVNDEDEYAIPLEAAVCTGNNDIIRLLLKNGANPNQKNKITQFTILAGSISTGNYEAFKLLLEAGAKVTTMDAAVAVSEAPDDQKWLELLDSAGCDFRNNLYAEPEEVVHFWGYTLLGLASKSGSLETTKFLINKGVEINERQLDGKTALMVAAENGHLHIVKYLMENGADPRIINDGFNAEDIARINGHKDIVEYLNTQS